MNNWTLDFITYDDYKKHVTEYVNLILNSTTPKTLHQFNNNIIDPVKLTFSYFTGDQDKTDIIESETLRQADKTLNNHIGYFHQNIFKYIKGWSVPSRGFDVVNDAKTIYVEMKNKHNTMNSSSGARTFIKLLNKVAEDPNYTAMLVEIIAKTSQDIIWSVSVDGERQSNQRVRRVSIDKFYEIATGDPYAYKKVIEWLPITIKEVIKDKKPEDKESKIIKELEKNGSFFKGLYNLAYKTYNGFDELNFVCKEELGDDFK